MTIRLGLLACVAALMAGPALAGDPASDRYFLIPNVSTLGAGIEAGYKIDHSWRARLGLNAGAVDFTYQQKKYDLHNRVSLISGGVTFDYRPTASNFYVSGGLRLSGNAVDGRVRNLTGRLKNGAHVYVPDPLTRYSVTQNTVQPYLGGGYSIEVKPGLSLNFDIGALYAGTPDLDVNSRAHRLGFSRRDIRREIEQAQNRISPYKVLPVVQVGLIFKF